MIMDINNPIRTLKPVALEQPGFSVQQRHASAANTDKQNAKDQIVQKPANAETVSATPVKNDKKASAELNAAVQQMNTYVQNIQRDLQFSIDEESGRNVVKVIDSKSKEVIRQIPSEEVLALARQWAEQQADDESFNLLKTTA
jgi:flagellar protein FlaG